MLFIWYPKCSTSRSAKHWLDQEGLAYTARSITEETPTAAELKAWLDRGGLTLKQLWNTSGRQYRALGLKDRLSQMSEEEQLTLLASDGMLLKRPILVTEGQVLTGFSPDRWQQALRSNQ